MYNCYILYDIIGLKYLVNYSLGIRAQGYGNLPVLLVKVSV